MLVATPDDVKWGGREGVTYSEGCLKRCHGTIHGCGYGLTVCMDLRGSMLMLTPARGLEFDFCFRDSVKKEDQIRSDGSSVSRGTSFCQMYMYSSGWVYLFVWDD